MFGIIRDALGAIWSAIAEAPSGVTGRAIPIVPAVPSTDPPSCASTATHGAVGCAEPSFEAGNRHHRVRQRADRAVRRRVVPDVTRDMTQRRSLG